MTNEELLKLGKELEGYCKKFNVPIEYLFEILEDQKVTPMIRGKATEYSAYLKLEELLPRNVWSVQKLNLNAQTGTTDEDISITHRRSGTILKVESKNAVRGSFNDGKKTKIIKEPHFKVKCHRSRSNISLAGTSNDRYSVDSFDLIITNTSNAFFEGNTLGETLEIVKKEGLKEALYVYYSVDDDESLISKSYNHWLYCVPEDIAVDGFIPRTPYVKLVNDINWRPLNEIENRLLEVVANRRNQASRRN